MLAFLKSVAAYLRARLTEVTSLAGAIGLPAIWLGYYGGALTLAQAKYATGAAVIAYLFPQSKIFPPAGPPKSALAILGLSLAAMLALSGCAPDLSGLARDNATVCATITGPGWTATAVRTNPNGSSAIVKGCGDVEIGTVAGGGAVINNAAGGNVTVGK